MKVILNTYYQILNKVIIQVLIIIKENRNFLLNKENMNNSIVYTYISKDGYEKFKFIDLFAGIGGFHQAMENLGGECVFASEIDKYAIETYKKIMILILIMI